MRELFDNIERFWGQAADCWSSCVHTAVRGQPGFRLMFAIGFFSFSLGYGQAAPQPHFEVASIKTAGGVFSTRPRPERSGGRIRWTTQLCYIVGYAHRLDFSQVSGQKCSSVYSLDAIFDPTATDDQVRLMVQSLLTDRFKMRSHRTATQADGYGLVIGKGGPKIKAIKQGEEPPPMPEQINNASSTRKTEIYISATSPHAGVIEVTGRGVSISQLAENLQRMIGIPVWDRSGLSGDFYFVFRFKELNSSELDNETPSLMTALEQSLGLKLEKQKGLVETLVIDYLEEPSAN